jgi:TPR repeat protein
MDNPDAMARLGFMYYKGEFVAVDFEMSLNYFKKVATLGDTEARFNLGVFYQYGLADVIAIDLVKAFEHLKFAADQIERKRERKFALCTVGLAFRDGVGATKDIDKSIEYFERAVKLGSIDAMISVADLYLQDARNPDRALELYNQAAALGDPRAYHNLGTTYQQGSEQNI